MKIVYIADPARVGMTRHRLLSLRHHGYRIFNAHRPLVPPHTAPKPADMRVPEAPHGWWITIARGDELNPPHPSNGTWLEYLEREGAVEVQLLASRDEAVAAIQVRMVAESPQHGAEYFNIYVADNMLDEAAHTVDIPWLPEWQAA